MKEDHNKLYKKRQQEMALRINELTKEEADWFWKLTYNQLKWYSYKFSQDRENMLEITSLALDKIIKGKDTYLPEKALFTSWCHRILHNEALNFLYNKKKLEAHQTRIDDEDEHYQLSDETQDEDPERVDILHSRVVEEIEKLPSKLKRSAELFFLAKEKQEVIAEELGVPLGTIKTRVRHAKAIISKAILKTHNDLVHY